MSTDLRRIERRIDSFHAIRDIVTSMRALAATQVRRATDALVSVRLYELELRRVLRALPPPAAPGRTLGTTILVFGADQGMCGALPKRMKAEALKVVERVSREPTDLLVIGRRTHQLVDASNLAGVQGQPGALSFDGVDRVVREVAHALVEREAGHLVPRRILALYPAHDDRSSQVIETRLFPVEPGHLRSPGAPPPRLPPRTFVPPEEVVSRLVEEWIYTELYRAALEAFTAEQAARLRTTDGATGTIDRRLVELRLEHNRSRQEQITNEVQEVIIATEAMSRDG